ncbi:hypothetical protein VTK26DRAFT_4040 [Humicola hyalothermophila]
MLRMIRRQDFLSHARRNVVVAGTGVVENAWEVFEGVLELAVSDVPFLTGHHWVGAANRIPCRRILSIFDECASTQGMTRLPSTPMYLQHAHHISRTHMTLSHTHNTECVTFSWVNNLDWSGHKLIDSNGSTALDTSSNNVLVDTNSHLWLDRSMKEKKSPLKVNQSFPTTFALPQFQHIF